MSFCFRKGAEKRGKTRLPCSEMVSSGGQESTEGYALAVNQDRRRRLRKREPDGRASEDEGKEHGGGKGGGIVAVSVRSTLARLVEQQTGVRNCGRNLRASGHRRRRLNDRRSLSSRAGLQQAPPPVRCRHYSHLYPSARPPTRLHPSPPPSSLSDSRTSLASRQGLWSVRNSV